MKREPIKLNNSERITALIDAGFDQLKREGIVFPDGEERERRQISGMLNISFEEAQVHVAEAFQLMRQKFRPKTKDPEFSASNHATSNRRIENPRPAHSSHHPERRKRKKRCRRASYPSPRSEPLPPIDRTGVPDGSRRPRSFTVPDVDFRDHHSTDFENAEGEMRRLLGEQG